MLTVTMQDFTELSETEADNASNNGAGKEYAHYLRVSHNGETIFLESDAMEPEDATFTRDLSWIKDLIIKAYEKGKEDASVR